jgi:DNA replication protein DnaC
MDASSTARSCAAEAGYRRPGYVEAAGGSSAPRSQLNASTPSSLHITTRCTESKLCGAPHNFDFDYDPTRKRLRARYLALHDLAFLQKGLNPLFLGVPGTGKTFLARALAYRACQGAHRVVVTSATRMLNDLAGAELHGQLERALRRYVRADFLVLDDFAVLAMDPAQAKLAFQVISDRYDYRRSTCMTTNRAFKDWTKVFPDALNAQVIAKRLTERAEHFVLDGKGYYPTKSS